MAETPWYVVSSDFEVKPFDDQHEPPELPSGGGFIKDTLSFGTNGVAHHLNYFIQPRVCRALIDWLEIRETATHK